MKFFQAIPIIESGAADKLGLTDSQLALACASHNAEPVHVDAVRNWLTQLNLEVDDLENGATLPLSENAAHALIGRGETPTKAHQNCSGKHCGMLAVAKQLGAGSKGYSEYDHPSQQAWMGVLGDFTDLDIRTLHWERDGCGLPAVQMPLRNLALGFARFAKPDHLADNRAAAVGRLQRALTAHPEMVAGTGRCCTAVIRETGGKVLVKTGAEGVFGGCIPERGIGFVLKADDGAIRGSEVLLGGLLKRLDAIDASTASALGEWFNPQIINSQGYHTGEVVASDNWLS